MNQLRILLVHPGASHSTADVLNGIKSALTKRGHAVFDYALDARIGMSGRWLNFCWIRGKKAAPKPCPSDTLYHAGGELVTRALRVQPDVVLVVSGMFMHPDVFVLMKRAGLKVALLLTESPYDDEKQARVIPYTDAAWSNERTSAERLGIRYLPHAWDEDVHWPGGPSDDTIHAHDVVFVGTGFQERIDLLASVDWTGIDLGLYGSWNMMGSRSSLRQYIKGEYVDNADTARLYRRAKIGLNLYRQSVGFGRKTLRVTDAESLNLRAYELAATGCFTISDNRAEVGEMFGPLVPTFSTPQEMRDLIDRYLKNDQARLDIEDQLPSAVSGQTWAERAAKVESDLFDAGIGTRQTPTLKTAEPIVTAVGG